MPRIPIKCTNPKCNNVFPSPFDIIDIFIDGEIFILKCPKCGSEARNLDGQFAITEDEIIITDASDFSKKILAEFLQIARDASEGRLSRTEAISKAKELDPRLGYLLRRYLRRNATALTLVAAQMLHAESTAYRDGTEYHLQIVHAEQQAQTLIMKELLETMRAVLGRLEKQQRLLEKPKESIIKANNRNNRNKSLRSKKNSARIQKIK